MQKNPLENYLESLEASLNRLTPSERESQVREVRGHLETLVNSHLAQGKSLEEATRLALEQFGRAEQLGGELNRVALHARIGKSACWVTQSFSIWCAVALLEFTFYSWMNDKPTDFPYSPRDRFLMAALLATWVVFTGPFFERAWKKRRAMP